MLKYQESKTKNLVNNVLTSSEERFIAKSNSYKYEVKALQDVAREQHAIFGNLLNSSKESIESKLKDLWDLFSKQVMNLDNFCESIKDKVDFFTSTRTLVEYVSAFNKDYVVNLKLKREADDKVFTNIEQSLSGFHDKLKKLDFSSTSSISQKKISSMILSVESCFNTELSPILDLVPRLPTNAPRSSANVSLGGEKGLGH